MLMREGRKPLHQIICRPVLWLALKGVRGKALANWYADLIGPLVVTLKNLGL